MGRVMKGRWISDIKRRRGECCDSVKVRREEVVECIN
ncbi:hypothetical protein LINPERPRIM_LOCUS40912 [Linum perenne]